MKKLTSVLCFSLAIFSQIQIFSQAPQLSKAEKEFIIQYKQGKSAIGPDYFLYVDWNNPRQILAFIHYQSWINGQYKPLSKKRKGFVPEVTPEKVIQAASRYTPQHAHIAKYIQNAPDVLKTPLMIWAFIYENRNHWIPEFSDLKNRQNYFQYWAAYHGGLCGDTSTILGQTLIAAGYRVRYAFVKGHCTLEIYINHKWMVLDGDLGIIFYRQHPYNLMDAEHAVGSESLHFSPDPFYYAKNIHYYEYSIDHPRHHYDNIPPADVSKHQLQLPVGALFEIISTTPPITDGYNITPANIATGLVTIPVRKNQEIFYSSPWPIIFMTVDKHQPGEIMVKLDTWEKIKLTNTQHIDLSVLTHTPLAHPYYSFHFKSSADCIVKIYLPIAINLITEETCGHLSGP